MKKTLISIAVTTLLATVGITARAEKEGGEDHRATPIKHVLLISVDGLHQNDLDWYVQNHPASTLAALVHGGVQYKNAQTPFPSDSFPGLVGQLTGGNPASTGIYYDDGYDRSLVLLEAAGGNSTSCPDVNSVGAEVQYAENIDLDLSRIDAGANLPNLYPVQFWDAANPNASEIMQLTGNATDLVDANKLPLDPAKGCKPVYPHDYIRVNTIFEVAKQHNLRTAWTDKHPAYEILKGNSKTGLDEMFTPEINSNTNDANIADWTKDNIATQEYDAFKVQSIINEINGFDHSGNTKKGVPSIFGMNFQVVSTAQKLNKSSYLDSQGNIQTGLGGYVTLAGKVAPGPVLQGALKYVDEKIGDMKSKVSNDTVIILSAKHGQSPEKRGDLTIINDGNMLAALDAAWNTASNSADGLVAHAIDDDGVLLWLKDHSTAAAEFAKDFLWNYKGTGLGSTENGDPIKGKPFTHAGLKKIVAGKAAADFIGVSANDTRVPDVIGIAQTGSVYAGGKLSKIAEHGGFAKNDRHVPIVVWGAGIDQGKTVSDSVATTQIAPTILKLLGINPRELKAVQIEGTKVLPELK